MKHSALSLQQGTTLITCLMLLLLISLLALATANSSVQNTLIAQNALMSTQVKNDLKNTLDIATWKITHQTLANDEFIDNTISKNFLYDPYNNLTWPKTHSLPGSNDASEYIIEYLGCIPELVTSPDYCTDNQNTHPIHLYKITARTTSLSGHSTFDQKLTRFHYGPAAPRLKNIQKKG